MKCPKCQFENLEGMKFCGECGTKLELICPNCSFSNPPQFKFCGECGHEFRRPQSEPELELQPETAIDYTAPESYTPKHLVDKILTDRSAIEGERKIVTVLFADVAGFTSISEKLDPEEVHQIMDGCFKILMDHIHKYEGTINQFTGDGVMSLFGAPVAHEDHAQRACHAALAIQRAIQDYGDRIHKEYGAEFTMRIGLNSGPVVVGSIGDDLRMDYTAVGDTTNLAARMESFAKPGAVLVSESTHKIARDYFEFESLGRIEVKGKEEPQESYELIKTSEVETRIDASVAKGLTKFVGRKNSIATLMETFDKVQSGSGQVVGVVGEAGVGKSRILMELRSQLPQGEFTYLEGRCLQYGGSIIYMPILDILRSFFEIKEGDREIIIRDKMKEKALTLDEKLEGTLPSFQELFSLKVEDEEYHKLEPQQKREKTFEAIRDLFIRGSQDRLLVLAIEDLQWVDKSSEEFLDYLIGWLANVRILLILVYRPEYTHQWGSKSYYTKIGLDQLGPASCAELVQAMLEDGDVVPELRELILNRAAGNPLFMEEFTHTLLENGSIERKDKQYILSRQSSEIQVPDTIQGIISARMDRLEDNLKRIMQIASVIGKEFAFHILQTITGMRDELKFHLLNLQGLEFIYEKSLFPELEYIFKHALTQEVAYNSLLLKRRKEIHEKIGNAMEELYPERLEEFYEMLAYHYSKSENLEKAYQYLKSAGEKASRNYSHMEALIFFKQAIDVLNRFHNTQDKKRKKLEVFRLMLNPMVRLSYPDDSFTILQEGESLAKEAGDKKSLALFYRILSFYHSMKGNSLLGIKYAEDSFREAEKIQDIETMATTALILYTPYTWTGEFIKVTETAPSVLNLLEKLGKESESFDNQFNVYSYLCVIYGYSMAQLGNFEEGKIFCETGLRYSTEISDLVALGFSELYYGFFYVAKGSGRLEIEHFQNSIKYFEEAEWPFLLSMTWSGLGLGYYLLGDFERARKHIEKGLHIQRDLGAEAQLAVHYWFLGMVHFDSDDLQKAQDFAEKAVKISQKNNERNIEGESRISLGRILGKVELSKRDKAEESILQGIKILEELKLRPGIAGGYLYLGELYTDTSQREKALENLKKVETEFKDMGMDYWLGRTYAVYSDLYGKEGETSKAKENLNKAIKILKECGADGWVAKYEKELTE
jgi:class 3 adenylate cyclase/tetratricopeptide (TPR) repeat protein